MNDIINVLAEQSGFYVSESRREILIPDSSTDNVTEALREFAESIVRECINATGNCAGTGDLIKEHFGVR